MSNNVTYINWYDDTESYSKPGNSIIWRDIVTRTYYYLSKDKASEINNKGIKYINSLKDPERIYNFMCGNVPGLDKDLAKFPELPYIKKVKEENDAYRISDHVIIRTGILYSLFPKDENVRIYGLTKGINIFSKEECNINYEVSDKVKEALNLIDNVLIGEKVSENQCKDMKFDLVKGGTVKVKKYYLETNKIKDIRGASRILDDLNRKIIPDYIKENYIGECIVYSGGGNILGIFPSHEGKKVSRIIEEKHEEESITAMSSASYISCTLFDLCSDKYKSTMGALQLKVTNRQMSKFDFRTNPGIEYAISNKAKRLSGEELCEHCNIRQAFYEFHGEKLCASCLNKVIKGGADSRNDFKEQYRNFCINKGIKLDKTVNVDSLKDIGNLNSHGDFIAVIYGDGNNMGNIVQHINKLGEMRYFSNKTENAVFEAVYSALGKVLKHDGFEIIAIGGDDIFMVVPADKALEIGIELGEKFDDLFKNKSEHKYTVTMSLGIAISHSNTPIQYLFDLSQQLLKSAKKKSKACGGLGTVDIMALETESGVGASLKLLRKEMKNDNINLTLRPYTWEQARAIKGSVNTLKKVKARSKAYNFRDVSYNMGMEEGELYFSYQTTRLKGRDEKVNQTIEKSMKVLAKAFNLNEKALNLFNKDKNKVYSPWSDIVELWDYSEGEVKELE